MSEIGDLPVLWHVMKLCDHHGFRRFVLALGDRGWTVKRFFLGLRARLSDVTITTGSRHMPAAVGRPAADREITFVDTGTQTGTGARLRRVRRHLDGEHVLVAGLGGIGPVDLTALAREHVRSGRIATVAALRLVSPSGERVPQFDDAPSRVADFAPGGFSMLRRTFVDEHLDDDPGVDLAGSLRRLARHGEVGVYRHDGFWSALETDQDRRRLDAMWRAHEAPWLVGDAVPMPRGPGAGLDS
jgi:glucose-1-phosphate cytidylyltransferase